MLVDDNCHIAGNSGPTPQAVHEASTPPTKDKSIAQSLSAAMKIGGGAGANNVSRLEHDWAPVSEY